MAQTITTHDDHFVCPYCAARIRVVEGGSRLAGGSRCEHLFRVDGGRHGPKTGHFKAADDYFVFDTTQPPTVGVFVKRDDPRYARAHDSGHADPDWPPPIR